MTRGAASGYYSWKEADGRVRQRYVSLVVIRNYDVHVGAVTYIDEFSRPVTAIAAKTKTIEENYIGQYNKRFFAFVLVVIAVLGVLLASIFLYSSSVVRPIRLLSATADRIGLGDLKASVDLKGKGEVMLLAQSIERMQMSVRAAIERLQKRREAGAGQEPRQ